MVSGPKAAFDQVQPYLATIAASGVSYVGEGELARICKIAHNVFLGVVIQNLAEITILAQKAGVPRHAFLDFMNASVLGSTFTKYKSNALVNLDWTTTFTPALLRKDLDLGLKAARDLDVADAGDGGNARGAAEPFRRGDAQARSGRAIWKRISPRCWKPWRSPPASNFRPRTCRCRPGSRPKAETGVG